MRSKPIIFCLLFFTSLSAYPRDETENALIDRLAVATGTTVTDIVKSFVETYASTFAESYVKQKSSLPPEAQEVIRSDIAAYLYDQFSKNSEMNTLKYDMYRKYFTREELEELVKFYESPVGIKLKNTTPKMMAEIQAHTARVATSVLSNMQKDLPKRLKNLMREHGWKD